MWRTKTHVMLRQILHQQETMLDRLKEIRDTMATQDQVDALTAQVDALTAGSLATSEALANIQADIDVLAAAGADITNLQASVTAAVAAGAEAATKAQAIADER